jgi:phasin family protein
MSTAPEDLFKAQREHFERLMSLSKVLLDSTEKVASANMAAVRSQIESLHDHASRLAQAKTPKEWYELQVEYLKPAKDKAAEQVSKTYEISKETAEEIAKMMEAQINEFNHKVNDAFGAFMKQFPQGSDALGSAFNSLMAAGNNAYASAQKALKQAVDMAEANVKAMSGAGKEKKD